jgi:hypothetical protein
MKIDQWGDDSNQFEDSHSNHVINVTQSVGRSAMHGTEGEELNTVGDRSRRRSRRDKKESDKNLNNIEKSGSEHGQSASHSPVKESRNENS